MTILRLLRILITYSYIYHILLIYCFGPAFGDSDDDDLDLGDNMEDVWPDEEIPDHVNPNRSSVLPAPPPPLAFDMMAFMHKASSYDITEVIRQAEAMPLIPLHVPSERPGGEARREIMKARAGVREQQGLKTNQGPEVQLTMMRHSLCKECSAILCEAVQGAFHLSSILSFLRILIVFMLHSKNWWSSSWIWARWLDEDKEKIGGRGTA